MVLFSIFTFLTAPVSLSSPDPFLIVAQCVHKHCIISMQWLRVWRMHPQEKQVAQPLTEHEDDWVLPASLRFVVVVSTPGIARQGVTFLCLLLVTRSASQTNLLWGCWSQWFFPGYEFVLQNKLQNHQANRCPLMWEVLWGFDSKVTSFSTVRV